VRFLHPPAALRVAFDDVSLVSSAAYARHNGTAPLPVWSSKRTRHRLSRTGNRQLNAALHRIAIAQARCHPPVRELIARYGRPV
jgi:transposase